MSRTGAPWPEPAPADPNWAHKMMTGATPTPVAPDDLARHIHALVSEHIGRLLDHQRDEATTVDVLTHDVLFAITPLVNRVTQLTRDRDEARQDRDRLDALLTRRALTTPETDQ